MSKFKQITREKLDEIIKKHELWLNYEEDGERADLSFCDLSGMDLRDANLSYANLYFAKLTNASLREANLYFANLTDSNLKDTDLSQANTNQVKGIQIYSIDNIGSFNGKVTYIPSLDQCYAGCWSGNLEGFLEKGLERNKDDEKQIAAITKAYEFFKVMKEFDDKGE